MSWAMSAPNDGLPLIDRARAAQRERRWSDAENLWRQALTAHPRDQTALAGLGTVLLALERVQEARTLALALMDAAPRHVGSLTLAARVAAAEEDWAVAATHWRAVLAQKQDAPAALAGVGAALLAMRDFEGAASWAAELNERFPAQPVGPALSARVAAARGDGETALGLWRAAVKRFPGDVGIRRDLIRALTGAALFDEAIAAANTLAKADRESGLLEIANVMARREPNADHTDFWKRAASEFPRNATFARRMAMSALTAGRADEAIAVIDNLLATREATISDAGLIVGIAHVFAARGDLANLRGTVRRYLTALRGTPAFRLAALRLCRIVFAYFGSQDGRRRLSHRERTRRWLDRSSLKAKPRALLARSLALEDELATGATALIDTDISRSECMAFVQRVRESIARNQPFSLVRVNDGEANALPYEPGFADHFDRDAAERENVWWERAISVPSRRTMTARVAEAIWSADALGLPSFGRILRDVHLDRNDDFTARRTGRGLVAGVAAFEQWPDHRPANLPTPLFVSANLQQDLERWDVYRSLFDGIEEIVLVSCHAALPDRMQSLFNVKVAAFVRVPPGDASLHRESHADGRLLLDVLDDVVAQVESCARGRLVVVGAGYLGKWIVHRAKLAGGIALDLGSALDYWIGFKTRSYQDLA